ncbi:T6SS immunity protein Tli4 family protein [Burkholderia gladioli]|uniref:T6SS immunity protein Tli4 family protein n=1 Tax=Burkholderia gladioli TaxID=28095 RepID=UPI002FE03003
MSNLSQSMSESMRTVCVGRYTIDLPKSATDLKIGQKINGIRIEVQYPADAELLKHKVAADAQPGTGKAASKLINSPNSSPESSIFQISEDGQDLHTIHGYMIKSDVLYSFTVQVLSDSVVGAKVAILKLMQLIRPRENLDVPKEAGICIDRGFIPGDREQMESVTMVVNLPEIKSRFGVDFDSGDQGTKENIISRMSNLPLPLANFVSQSSTIVRREERKIDGRKGDEYDLIDKSAKTASFEWSAMPGEDGVREPGIDATLDSYEAVKDQEVGSLLAAWDAILNSLKRR